MLRLPISRASPYVRVVFPIRGTTSNAPEKVEVFIDEKRVLVDPGTTVLQVCLIGYTVSIPLIVVRLLITNI